MERLMGKVKKDLTYNRDELLNSWKCSIRYNGVQYTSAELAFKAQKTKIKDAKDIMYQILLCKFLQNPELAQELLDTAFSEIEDTDDLSGTVLMQIREQIRNIR